MYLDNLQDNLAKSNMKKKHRQSGIGWDNRKDKMYHRHTPRGKIYRKLQAMEWRMQAARIEKLIKEYS